jgi:hypothetical protein
VRKWKDQFNNEGYGGSQKHASQDVFLQHLQAIDPASKQLCILLLHLEARRKELKNLTAC